VGAAAGASGAMEHTNHQLMSAAGKEIASGFEEHPRVVASLLLLRFSGCGNPIGRPSRKATADFSKITILFLGSPCTIFPKVSQTANKSA
jgi:hypothetical protein